MKKDYSLLDILVIETIIIGTGAWLSLLLCVISLMIWMFTGFSDNWGLNFTIEFSFYAFIVCLIVCIPFIIIVRIISFFISSPEPEKELIRWEGIR